jgi:molybdopterin-guanine dinucleotide biosynthesis protein A
LSVTGIVLAGGLGRRMGGVDKGLQPLRGKPMVEHVLERLAPQVDEIIINANQNAGVYATFGHRWSPTTSAASRGRSPGCTPA